MQTKTANKQSRGKLRWDDVRIFLAAHRQKSLSAAAQRLGVDTSTVSRRLAALEASLGVRLFERSRDGLLETRAAARVLVAAEAMEAAEARLTRDATDVEALAEGIVRVSAAPGMADVFIAPALARLHKRFPKIAIELDASVRALDLSKHEAEIALRSVPPRGADLVITKIGTAPWVVATSPTLAKHLGVLRRWDDHPWITWDRDLATLGPARWLGDHAPKAQIALRTSHFSSQLAAARAGLGLVLAPEPYLRPLGLTAVKVGKALTASAAALPSDSLWLVGHRLMRDVPRVAAVWGFLADELRKATASNARSLNEAL